MKLATIHPFVTPLLISMLLVASALLLWRVPAAQAAQQSQSAGSCIVQDKNGSASEAERLRVETMLTLHRGW